MEMSKNTREVAFASPSTGEPCRACDIVSGSAPTRSVLARAITRRSSLHRRIIREARRRNPER